MAKKGHTMLFGGQSDFERLLHENLDFDNNSSNNNQSSNCQYAMRPIGVNININIDSNTDLDVIDHILNKIKDLI